LNETKTNKVIMSDTRTTTDTRRNVTPEVITLLEPRFYRFRLGERRGSVLSDGSFFATPEQVASGADPAQLQALWRHAFLPAGNLHMEVSPLLLEWGEERILVDAGCGRVYGERLGQLPRALAAAGYEPESITTVVITHLHLDHIGGLLDPERRLRFPRARILVSRDEVAFWSQSQPDLSQAQIDRDKAAWVVKGIHDHLAAIGRRLEVFSAGDTLFEGVSAFALPGHTPGQVGFEITSGEDSIWHVADALTDPVLHIAHPEWINEGDASPAVNATTRRALLDRAVRERRRIFGYHFPWPGFGHVRENAAGEREFVPERMRSE
jgi:glyoxylase-like metal-dependent hydrolase (beta-lactamase superfamily II)